MAPKLTINGVDRTALIRMGDDFQNPTLEMRRNQRGSFQFDIELEPAENDVVIWYGKDGVTPIFGGLVNRLSPVEVPLGADYCSRVEVADFSKYYEFGYWTKQYTTNKTVKQVLDDLQADKLSLWGVTIHASQIAGVTLTAPFGWTRVLVAQVIVDLCSTRYIPITSPTKTLRLVEPGTTAAPVNLDEDTCSRLTWTNNTFRKANTVIGVFGADGALADTVRKTWTTDGVATSFTIALTNIPSSPDAPNVVSVNGVDYPLWPLGEGFGLPDGATWDAATANGTLTFNGASASLVDTAGLVVYVDYRPMYPFEVTKTSGASPQVEIVLDFPKIAHWQQANDATQDALNQLNQTGGKTYIAETIEDGFDIGQLVVIDVPERKAVAVNAVVVTVRGEVHNDLLFEYTIEADSSLVLPPDALSDLKQQIGSSSGGGQTLSGSGGWASVLGSPFPLGGLDTAAVPMAASPVYAPVWNYVTFTARFNFTALVRVWLWVRVSGTCTARLRNLTDSTTVGTSSAESGTSRPSSAVTFNAALVAGKEYRLEVLGSVGEDVYGIGSLEAA